MSNTIYSNFFLSNEIEDQYNSHLDLQRFCTIDNNLVGQPGMIRKINRYSAVNGVQKLSMTSGNTQSIEVTYAQRNYEIVMAQGRFVYYDEEAMTDPMVVPVGVKHIATSMFNTVNDDIYAEFKKATQVVVTNSFGFDCFADAQSLFPYENIEGVEMFAFVAPSDVAALRKALGTSLQYVEAFVRQGYIGTVAGVNVYTKKDATAGTICIGTREAVTVFNKKGVEVEQTNAGNRSADDANIRKNTVFGRKYYLAALTDETKCAMIIKGTASAVASNVTSPADNTIYYKAVGNGYVQAAVTSASNPYSEGWYTITAS